MNRLALAAARPTLRAPAARRRLSSGPGAPNKPAESSTAPNMPGWQIAAVAGVGFAGVYALFIAKPAKVAQSPVPTNQTRNPSPSQTDDAATTGDEARK